MVAPFLAGLEPSLSSARLDRYRSMQGDPLETAINYLWNMALCESLYTSLNMTEVALRNGLHRTLTRHFGTPTWYDRRGVLESYQEIQIKDAKKTISRYGDPITADRVVSQVNFGFWVTILSRTYDARLWSVHNSVTLKGVFMRIPRNRRQRQIVHQQYNEIRELRNRVMHHEPLFDDRMLSHRYGEVKRGLHWLNPEMVDCLELYDRSPHVYAYGRDEVEAKLKNHLGIP